MSSAIRHEPHAGQPPHGRSLGPLCGARRCATGRRAVPLSRSRTIRHRACTFPTRHLSGALAGPRWAGSSRRPGPGSSRQPRPRPAASAGLVPATGGGSGIAIAKGIAILGNGGSISHDAGSSSTCICNNFLDGHSQLPATRGLRTQPGPQALIDNPSAPSEPRLLSRLMPFCLFGQNHHRESDMAARNGQFNRPRPGGTRPIV